MKITDAELIGRALDNLVLCEIRYYYKRRSKQRSLSNVVRLLIWVLASAGTVIPLLVATNKDLQWLVPWGYVALAVATATFALDRLFDLTEGYSRFAKTQLQLERILTQFRLRRFEIMRNGETDEKVIQQLFNQYHEFCDLLYDTILGETEVWYERLRREMQAIEQQVQNQGTTNTTT